MNKFIKAIGGPKIAILIAIAVAVLVVFGFIAATSGHGGHGAAQHGHEH